MACSRMLRYRQPDSTCALPKPVRQSLESHEGGQLRPHVLAHVKGFLAVVVGIALLGRNFIAASGGGVGYLVNGCVNGIALAPRELDGLAERNQCAHLPAEWFVAVT